MLFEYSESASLHQAVRKKGVVKMKPVDLSLGPKLDFYLEPGASDTMLVNLTSPLDSGCAHSLDLNWTDGIITASKFFAGEINQNSRVLPESATGCPR